MALQGDSSPPTVTMASTTSQLDSIPCIPRTAESITNLLKTPELFPRLQEDEMKKWVQVCEHYRDKAYSGCEIGHLEPFNWDNFEDKYYPQQTNPTNNQQHTPDVEYRQNHDVPDDLKDSQDKSKPE